MIDRGRTYGRMGQARYLVRDMLVFAPWVAIGLFGDAPVSPLVDCTTRTACEGADAAMLAVGVPKWTRGRRRWQAG